MYRRTIFLPGLLIGAIRPFETHGGFGHPIAQTLIGRGALPGLREYFFANVSPLRRVA
jgi:hypothetical protein